MAEPEGESGHNNLLSLKWNNHLSNFKLIIASLQEKSALSDATLACEGQLFPVHKLVLSTCSEFFGRVFSSTPCKHPVIVLHDLQPQHLHYLLSYMYAGEVNVPQSQLPTLIRAAETLQIKGLAAPDEEPVQGTLPGFDNNLSRSEEKTRDMYNNKSTYKSPKKRLRLSGDGDGSSYQNSVTMDRLASKELSGSNKCRSNKRARRRTSPDRRIDTSVCGSDDVDGKSTDDNNYVELDDGGEEADISIKEEETFAPDVGRSDNSMESQNADPEAVKTEDDGVDDISESIPLQQDNGIDWATAGGVAAALPTIPWMPFSSTTAPGTSSQNREELSIEGDGDDDDGTYTVQDNNNSDDADGTSQPQDMTPEEPNLHYNTELTFTSPLNASDLSGVPITIRPSSNGLSALRNSGSTIGSLSPSSLLQQQSSNSLQSTDDPQLLTFVRSVGNVDGSDYSNSQLLSAEHLMCPPQTPLVVGRPRTNTGRRPPGCSPGGGPITDENRGRSHSGSSGVAGMGGAVLMLHDCPVCPKMFQSRADMVRHLRTHTGERPFKCPHCDYSAALKGNLKSHILSRHTPVKGSVLQNIALPQ
uniref:Protein abrupt-like n=1 Tax=Hirondellea gigas TaxID=1518452 RepID=A0A2P2I7E8_9CRUS